MDTTSILWITVGITVGTFLLRLSFIQIFANREVPPLLEELLRYVPSAAVSAIILPAVLIVDGSPDLSLGNERILAGAVALAVALRTRSFPMTVGVGMGIFWLLRSLM
ncbi:MAG: AzlD domain-containing protein [Clostridia bacterium]